MKLGLVGCGFMGEAVLKAALDHGLVQANDAAVAEISAERRDIIQKRYGVRVDADPASVVRGADLLLLAVKPQEFASASASMRGRLAGNQAVASIMAGVRIDTISRALEHRAVVRVMPNTPASIGEGMSVWFATNDTGEASKEQVRALLGAMGRELEVHDEKYIDMATALSSSGPAFVYLLMEAFIDAGVHVGFRRDVAEQLALQTFIGSAKYAASSGKHLAQLRNEVTSPAGTTAEGLFVLEEAGVRAAIVSAIEAAYRRAQELGG